MKNTYIHLISIIFFALLVISCKEKIDLEIPNGDPKLVVEAEVSTEVDSSFVRLTKSANYYSSADYIKVKDALVVVNSDTFFHVADGVYRPKTSYEAVPNTTYNLKIVAQGKTYNSTSTLTPMFRVDSVQQVFKPAQGFLKEGYTLKYFAYDDREPIKYTYFRFGKNDLQGNDSLFDAKILFDNGVTRNGSYEFELPFLRLKPTDYSYMIFRSVDKNMYEFINAYNSQTTGAPGPFQVPPANLPTNIMGGALGYFATYDVVRTNRFLIK